MRRRSVAFGLLAALAAGDAAAQFGGMGGRRGGRGGGANRAKSDTQREPVDALETTLEELRVDLTLTAEQQPRWDAYREKVEALAGDVARERQRQRAAQEEKVDAVHQLNRLVDTQRNRFAAMEDIAEAGSALYSTFTAQQKQIADLRLAKALPRLG